MRKLNIFCWLVVIFAFSYFGGHFAYWLLIDATDPSNTGRALTDEELKEHKRLQRKHGDYPVYYFSDKPDEKYFIRDGKKCRWL
jgi:hypothetical protein